MKQYAFLEFTFIFDPAATWQHLYEFEKDLADFFAARGFDANILKSVEGGPSKRIILISPANKIEDIAPPRAPEAVPVATTVKASKQILNKMRNRQPTEGELKFKKKLN